MTLHLAIDVEPALVNVDTSTGKVHGAVEVAVLYGIAATGEVAKAAVPPRRQAKGERPA